MTGRIHTCNMAHELNYMFNMSHVITFAKESYNLLQGSFAKESYIMAHELNYMFNMSHCKSMHRRVRSFLA